MLNAHSLKWSPQGSKERLSNNFQTSQFDGLSSLPRSLFLYQVNQHPANAQNEIPYEYE